MIEPSAQLKAAIGAPANQPVDLYELYLDSGTLYYAAERIDWNGHTYLPYVQTRSEIKRYDDGQFDNVRVTFSNVDTTLAQALLNNDIEGRTLIIRKIDRTVAGDSIVLFDGPMERPERITETDAEVSAQQALASIDFDAPARLFGVFCPWLLKGYECGYAGAASACDKSWSNCAALANTARFGAFRFIPHSGTYQYAEVETKRAWYSLGLLKRKKTKWISANFEAVDDTPYDVPVPIVYGRVQMSGITIQHEDQGGVTKALVAFCIGAIENIYYLRANNAYITDFSLHQGDLGGNAGQAVDPRFPQSYEYSLLAYAGVTIPSDVRAVDPAPAVTAVITGRKVAVFGANGMFLGAFWSDNPVWCVRDFLTLPLEQGGMGIPDSMLDDVVNAQTAAYCDELVLDTTNDQKIYNPPELPQDIAYKRYRSTGVAGGDPEVDGPYDDYTPGVDDDTSRTPVQLQVKRFTMNVAIAKQEKAVDILFKKLLPSFRGYLTFSKEGKIQIRCERPVLTSTAMVAAAAGANQILCTNPGQWAAGQILVASPLTADAEVLTIAQVLANGLQFTAPLAHAHENGAELLQVAMAFDDSNVMGSLEYPLSDRVPSTNRITIKYVDSPAGFEARELRINDFEHQAKTHRVNNQDLDGSAIDSYFQAWRIGQWARAKARDLGKFCQLRADIKATLLEVGDVVAVSGREVGLQAVPFRIIELGFGEDDEVSIVGQVYSTAVYDDTAPQATVSVPALFGAPEPVQAPDAPNVTAATAAAFYCDENGTEAAGGEYYGFKGTATVPRANVDFAHLREVHIVVTDPGGRSQDIDTLYARDLTADTVQWKIGGTWPRPSANETFPKIEFLCKNDDAKITDAPFTIQNIAVVGKQRTDPFPPSAAGQVTAVAVTVLEVGVDPVTKIPKQHLRVSYTPPANWTATAVTAYLQRGAAAPTDEGSNKAGADGNTIDLWVDRPGADTPAYVWVTASKPEFWVLLDTATAPPATRSAQFTLLAPSAPSATGIVNAQPGTLSYGQADEGACYWGLKHLTFTTPTAAADPEFWYTELTVQKTDAAGNPADDYEGVERAVEQFAEPGKAIDYTIDYWTIPPVNAACRKFRLRLHNVSRLGQRTLQATAWSGATYAQVEPLSKVHPGDVTLGTPRVRFSAPDSSGKVNALITIPFTAPNQPEVWNHVSAYLSAPDDVATASKAVVGASGDVGFFVGAAGVASNITPTNNPVPFGPFGAGEPVITISFPAPDVAQTWRVRAPSGSATEEAPIATAPSVTFTVDPALALGPSGAEYAPNATNFNAATTYQTADGGNKTWGFDDSWQNPTSHPRYALLGGYDVVVEYADGRRETQDSPAKTRTSGAATGWDIPTGAQSFKLWLVAWDIYGRRNSIVAGVTPCVAISVAPQTGGAGQEYASLVSGLTAVVAYSKSVDGVEQWKLTTTWTNPTGDAAFAGGKIVLRPNSGADQTLGYAGKTDTQAVWGPFNIGSPITYTPYFVSMDNNGRENTLAPGTTPTAAAFTIQAQTTGGLNAGRLDPTTLNPTLAIVGNKLGVPDGALDIASFASTIRPPLLLSANPALPNALYPAGTLLYNTTEHKLYRVAAAGNAWQAAVGTDDLVAHCVTAGLVAAGAIGTVELYAGEILVGGGGGKPGRFKVVGADGTTMMAWIGDDGAGHQGIYAKSLWVGPSINNPQFYCDANGNATFSGALAATVIIAGAQVNGAVANATNAALVPGSGITSDITAGGSQPVTKFVVLDGTNAQILWAGKYGNNYGLWGRNVWIGGTGPGDAQLYVDALGNVKLPASALTAGTISAAVSMTAPDLQITGAGFTASINSTDGVKVASGNYYALLKSGFFEAKYLTNVNAHALLTPFQFDLQADTGKYITMTADTNLRAFSMTDNSGVLQIWMQSGTSGFIDVRQGAEYRVGGSAVINASRQFVGSGVVCPNYGVAASGFNPYAGGVQFYGATEALAVGQSLTPSTATVTVVTSVDFVNQTVGTATITYLTAVSLNTATRQFRGGAMTTV